MLYTNVQEALMNLVRQQGRGAGLAYSYGEYFYCLEIITYWNIIIIITHYYLLGTYSIKWRTNKKGGKNSWLLTYKINDYFRNLV